MLQMYPPSPILLLFSGLSFLSSVYSFITTLLAHAVDVPPPSPILLLFSGLSFLSSVYSFINTLLVHAVDVPPPSPILLLFSGLSFLSSVYSFITTLLVHAADVPPPLPHPFSLFWFKLSFFCLFFHQYPSRSCCRCTPLPHPSPILLLFSG